MVKSDELYQLKWQYNNKLNRYYNGCNYLEENPNQFEKHIKTLIKIKEELEEILSKIQTSQAVSTSEILGGFELC